MMMYASILRYHFEKKTKPSLYKKASLDNPELIPGLVFEFQNDLRGQELIYLLYNQVEKGAYNSYLRAFWGTVYKTNELRKTLIGRIALVGNALWVTFVGPFDVASEIFEIT